MVGTISQAADRRQQAELIRLLPTLFPHLYQHDLPILTPVSVIEARWSAPSLHMPVVMHPTQTLPGGWDPAAGAAAVGTEAAAGSADAEDPCPAGQQQHTTQLTAEAAAAAAAAMPQQQQEVEEDSDDEPPGISDTSEGDEMEDYDEIEDEEEDVPALVDYGSADDSDHDMDVEPPHAGSYHNTTAPAAAATQAIQSAWDRASRRAADVAPPQEQQQQLGFGTTVPVLPPEAWRRPAACSFLQRGVAFEGSQQLTTQMLDMQQRNERWTVSVTIQDVDLTTGHIAGTMCACDIPDVSHCVETFWEGCVIDDVNHTFCTRAWGASKEIDLQHWAKFDSFASIASAVRLYSGRCGQLEQHPVIYMRWKEQCFVQPRQRDCGLTIAGFYYVALDRRTGQLQGFYYDPSSSPYQELKLSVCRGGSSSSADSSNSSTSRGGSAVPAAAGVSFATYSFA